MYSFFVLGQVPGTDITITFTMWLELCAAAISIAALAYVHYHQRHVSNDLGADNTVLSSLTI